jgi:hypothetical protein
MGNIVLGQRVKAISHHEYPSEVMDYVYYGTLIGEDHLTYVVRSGYTQMTLMKDNTVIEPWEG